MNTRRRVVALGVCLSVVAIAVVAYWAFRPGEAQPPRDAAAKPQQEGAGAADAAAMGLAGKGPQKAAAGTVFDPKNPALASASRLKPVRGDANPSVKSVMEALRDQKHPERLSVMAPPPAFDAQAFAADPASYLEVVEPGRVFQTAKPGKDVPRLRAVSPPLHIVKSGEAVRLRVVAAPEAPVSFTSLDLGQFDNELTSITVKANKRGIAEARFTASAGATDDVRILAGSPVASGQARFVVSVAPPAKKDAAAGLKQPKS